MSKDIFNFSIASDVDYEDLVTEVEVAEATTVPRYRLNLVVPSRVLVTQKICLHNDRPQRSMKAICIENKVSMLSSETARRRLRKQCYQNDSSYDLDIGKEYTVYGILSVDNSPWYFLCTNTDDLYTIPYPGDFFDIVDERMSSYWIQCHLGNNDLEKSSSLVFEEWAADPMYYERLLDGYPEEEAIFAKYKKLMDDEYRDPSELQPKFGIIGRIVDGRNKGDYIFLEEGTENIGGYFLHQYKSLHSFLDGEKTFNNWFDSKSALQDHFDNANWIIDWHVDTPA